MGFENCVTLKKVEGTRGRTESVRASEEGRSTVNGQEEIHGSRVWDGARATTDSRYMVLNFPWSGTGKRRGHCKTESKGKCLYQLLMRYEGHRA